MKLYIIEEIPLWYLFYFYPVIDYRRFDYLLHMKGDQYG
nr:MAG TPA: hypothetical protein [Caudoviricetes sp.]DAS62706.1 MAG TPA: hypothetical protein [Caudoviricetes sp.]DAX34875.1 MAG TPA: hypothetical protein [Caudoviricetes sp.]